jgi:hypothetical protein
MDTYVLMPSNKTTKKWMVITPEGNKIIHFGAKGMSDYTTINKNPARMKLYLQRHRGMGEDWNKSGIDTAGFWSRWALWSKPSLEEAIKLIEKKFKINIVLLE